MLAHLRRLSKDVLIYGSGRVAVQALSLLTIPIFTRIFTTGDYGIIETISALATVVALVSSLGLESASQRSYYDYTPEEVNQRRMVLSTTFWTLVCWSSVLGFILALCALLLSRLFFGDNSAAWWIRLAMIAVPVGVISNYFREVLRLRHQPERFALLSFINGLGTVGTSLLLVAGLHWGLLGNYVGALCGGLLGLGASIWLVRDVVHRGFDRSELRVMLAYGLPLVPVAASTLVLQVADRFFILHYVSTSEVGLYSLSVRLSNLLLFGVTAFGAAWSPFMFELFNRDPEQEKRLRPQALSLVTLVLCLGAIALSLYAREFFLTITHPQFENAYLTVGLLTGSVIILGMNTVIMSGISLSRQTQYFTWYTLACAAFNILLNFLLIPRYGMLGAAAATLASYIVLMSLYFYRSQLLSPVQYNPKRILALFSLTALAGSTGALLRVDPVWLGLAVKTPILLTCIAAALWVGLDDHQRGQAWQEVVRLVGKAFTKP